MSKQRYLSLATFIIAFLVFLAYSMLRPASPPILIGATMSETGAYNTQGIAAKNGYLLCQDHINEKGGVLGRHIEFLIYDDESDSERVVELYEKLIAEDQVDAIMGPYGSTLTEAVALVTERHRMVHITQLSCSGGVRE